MSGHSKREEALRADATAWRDRVIADTRGAEGRIAARSHQVSIDLIIAGAEAIAGYVAAGETEVARSDLGLQKRLSAGSVSDRQVLRLVRFLEARGFVTRYYTMIRPIIRRDGELPL
jgi:hypothetical protein